MCDDKKKERHVMTFAKKVWLFFGLVFSLSIMTFAIYTGSIFRHPVAFIFAILMFLYCAGSLWVKESNQPVTKEDTIKSLYACAFLFALAAGSLIYEGRVLARPFDFVLHSGIAIGCIIEAQKLKKKDKA